MSEVKIHGLKELHQALQKLPANIEKNVMRGALKKGANVLKEDAVELVPVDSGALKNSIKVRVSAKKGTIKAMITAGNKEAYYAHMVEYGTAAHFIKSKNKSGLAFGGLIVKGVHHPGSAPKPFMRPAFDTGYQQALDAFKDYAGVRIEKEFAKLARSAK